MIEWQSRPITQLLVGPTSGAAAGHVPTSSASTRGQSGKNGETKNGAQPLKARDNDLDTERFRRRSIIDLWLHERRYFAEVAYLLVSKALHGPSLGRTKGKSWRGSASAVMEDCGSEIVRVWQLNSPSPSKAQICLVVDHLDACLDQLHQAQPWLHDDEILDAFEIIRCQTLITEMVHALQLVFVVLDWAVESPSLEVFACWYRFMNKRHFLDDFKPPYPDETMSLFFVAQSLATVVSLAMIKLPQLLSALPALAGVAPAELEPPGSPPYYRNLECVKKTSLNLLEAAGAGFSTAGPAILAWSLALGAIGEYGRATKEARETRQAQQAIDRYEVAQQAELDSGRAASPRRSSLSSESSQAQSYFEEVNEVVADLSQEEDPPVKFLAVKALNQISTLGILSVISTSLCADVSSDRHGELGLRIRLVLLQLLRGALDLLDYSEVTVECCLAILNGSDSYWDRLDRPYRYTELEPARAFLGDQLYFKSRMWSVSLLRFPYETLPTLKLCQALGVPARDIQMELEDTLQTCQTFTILHDEDIAPVELVDDDDMIVSLRQPMDALTLHFPFLYQRPQRLLGKSSGNSAQFSGIFMLEADTRGRILSDGRPMVVAWGCRYTVYTFFGIVLKLAFQQRSSSRMGETAQIFDIANEVIGVLATLMVSSDSDEPPLDDELRDFLFERANNEFSNYDDTVSLVFELLESQLYRGTLTFNDQPSSDFLTNCIRFVFCILRVAPNRVWPFLGRSSLLGAQGSESRLVSAVSSLEIPNGQYSLLISSIRLFEALIHDAVTHASTRRAETRALTRFYSGGSSNLGPGTSEVTIQGVILNYTKVLVDVLESSRSWKFAQVEERLDINCRICCIFDQILNTYYGVDDDNDRKARLNACLAPAAEYFVEVFLSRTSSNLTTKALVDLILEGLATPVSTVSVKRWLMWESQVLASLKLATRFMRLSAYLKRPHSRLERLLFDSVQPLTQLYAAFPSYRLEVVNLLDSLLRGTGQDSEEPPSLLTNVTQANMRSFVDVLSHFDCPFHRPHLSRAIWRFLAVAVSHRQKWFTMYLLNGKMPRDSFKQEGGDPDGSSDDRSMSQIALFQLARLDTMSKHEALGVLEFLASAVDNSTRALEKLLADNKLESALKTVSSLRVPTANSQQDPSESPHLQYQCAALIVRIVAMILHYCNEKLVSGTKKQKPALFRAIQRSIEFLAQHGVDRPAYNASLHSKLKSNIEGKFPKCRLSNFKRTTLNPVSLGEGFYYDFNALKVCLKKDPHWHTNYERAIGQEIARANLNLSVVEAQVQLFYAWKLLIGELDEEMREKSGAHNYYLMILKSCLEANLQGQLPDRYFENLAQSRAEIALLLAQRFVRKSRNDEKVTETLHLAWNVLTDYSADIGAALVSDGAEYVRTLLKLLCVLLGASTTVISNRESWDKKKDEDDIRLVLDMLEKVASQAFRSLVKALHDDPKQVVPADFALISALLRCCLAFPGLERHPQALYAVFVDNSTLRVASTLLSWSNQLTLDGDPVYGEVSTAYLVELSKVAILAESILIEGVLAEALTARLLLLLRRPGGVGPFDAPARLHGIWARGLLPLALNILGAAGAPAAAEVSTFLAAFQPQLERATGAFDVSTAPAATAARQAQPAAAGAVTLALVSEAQSLALLATVLDRFRAAGASAGIVAADVTLLPWDRAAVRLDLEGYLERPSTLRSRLVPLGEREQAWARQKPKAADAGAESAYEEMVVNEIEVALSLLDGDDA